MNVAQIIELLLLGLGFPHGVTIRVRLCYTKHQRHRIAHQVFAVHGHKLMSFIFWIKIVVSLRLKLGENLSVKSPLLVRKVRGKIVPLTGNYVSRMDRIYAPILGWSKATIHSRRGGFATAAVVKLRLSKGEKLTADSPRF